ncbi:MAG: hypothetical protein V7785_10055 [Bermanella sp.]
MEISKSLGFVALLLGLSGCNITDNSGDTENDQVQVSFEHSIDSIYQKTLPASGRSFNSVMAGSRALDFDNAPFFIEGTPATLVSTSVGPFDLSGANALNFNIEVSDINNTTNSYSIILDNVVGATPAATTASEVMDVINAMIGLDIIASNEPLTLTGTEQGGNGNTITLTATNESGFTLTQLGFDAGNRINTGIEDKDSADYVLTGWLTARSLTTAVETNMEWSVYLDTETFTVVSNSTALLTPDQYDFSLLVSKGDLHYAASFQDTVIEGENSLPMELTPVLGGITTNLSVTDNNLISGLTRYEIDFDASEFSGLSDYSLGVSINGSGEQIFQAHQIIDPIDVYLNLESGAQNIVLYLYEGLNLVGTSVEAQEDQVVLAGQTINMDIAPLTGTTELIITENGGSASVTMPVPFEITNEVGNENNLTGLLALVGEKNNILNVPFTVSGGIANFVVEGVQFEDALFSLTFIETDTGDTVAVCSSEVTLTALQQTLQCNINLRKRALVTGHLLATLGLTVLTMQGEPANGAVIRDNDNNILGVTGSALFGTPGFVSINLIQGDQYFNISNSDNTSSTSVGLTFEPLEIKNFTIWLP